MIGDAVIYTEGKNGANLDEGLYFYKITGRSLNGVNSDSDNDWRVVTQTRRILQDDVLQITYEQDLDQTQWDISTEQVKFRYAIGETLVLQQQHTSTSDTVDLNLVTGGGTITGDDFTLQYE